MNHALFSEAVWYSLLFLSALLSTILLIKHRMNFIKHIIVPVLTIVPTITLVLSIVVGGEAYKYISDSIAIVWLLSALIASFSLRRFSRE